MKKINSVLIVDDSNSDVFLASHHLQESGLYSHVWSVNDGQAALDLYLDETSARRKHPGHPPDLILLDINMPRLNGFEFLDKFQEINRSASPAVVIVMVTSSEFAEDIKRAKSYDIVADYLVKPLELEAAIRLAETYGT